MARFTPNPRGIASLARTPEMTRHLRSVAERGAAEVKAAAPSILDHQGARIYGEASNGEGRIVVESPWWHLPEYGGVKYPMRPYIRPTVVRYLARIGGRFVGR